MSSHVNGLKLWFTRQTQWELEGNHILMNIALSFFLPVRIPSTHLLELGPGPFLYQVPWPCLSTAISLGFACPQVSGAKCSSEVLLRLATDDAQPGGRGEEEPVAKTDDTLCSQGLQASDFCSLSLCCQIVVTVGLSFTALSSLSPPPPREKRRKQSFTFWFTKCTFSVFCL